MQNYFELFRLPVQFALDRHALDAAYREIQSVVHPDRYITASDTDKRAAMQWATRTNDAYQTLRNPLKRAVYLCELNGFNMELESNTTMPVDFLMAQMEWRETLENARFDKDLASLETLSSELRHMRQQQIGQIEQELQAQQFANAVQTIRKMMFLEKMSDEISFAFDELDSIE